jgi:hypothetical protein
MKSFVRMKCHALVLDSEINSYQRISRTVYRIYVVAALRTMSAMKQINALTNRLQSRSLAFIVRCIVDAIKFGSKLIQSRIRHRIRRRLQLNSSSGQRETPKRLSLFQKILSDAYASDNTADGDCDGRCALSIAEVISRPPQNLMP